MKRSRSSRHVAAPLLASTALALLAACKSAPPQRCVDEHNQVVDESFCRAQEHNLNNNPLAPHYRFYYGGTGGFFPGSYVSGGSYTPTPGVSYSTGSSGSSTTRGGFGSTHGSSEGGGGEGGGHGGGGGE